MVRPFLIWFLGVSIGNGESIPPKVWLSGCIAHNGSTNTYHTFSKNTASQHEFENSCVKKIGNKYSYFKDTHQVIMFACEANYPIIWKFPVTHELLTEYTTISSFDGNSTNPAIQSYKGLVIMPCSQSMLMGLTLNCISTETNPELSSSVYISNSVTTRLQFPGDTLSISISVDKDLKILNPFQSNCQPFDAKEGKFLEKQIELNNLNEEPLIKTTRFPIEVLAGFYKCHNPNNSTYFYYNITQAAPKRTYKPVSSISNGARVNSKIHYESPESPIMIFSCCSGMLEFPPALLSSACYSHEDCQLRHLQLLHKLAGFIGAETVKRKIVSSKLSNASDCQSIAMYSSAYTVVCLGTDIFFTDTFVNVFHNSSNEPVPQRSRNILTQDKLTSDGDKYTPLLSRYVPESKLEELVTEQKIFVAVASPIKIDKRASLTGSLLLSKRFSDLYYENQTKFIGTQLNKLNDRRVLTDLREYERNTYFVGEPIVFVCFGLNFIYANGAKIRLSWKNGSTTDLKLESSLERQGFQKMFLGGNAFMFSGQARSSKSVISKPIIATEEIQSVECWMPKLGSSGWDKLVKRITVERPRFLEGEREFMTASSYASSNKMWCTIAEWNPSQHISVIWNDKQLQIKWENVENENFGSANINSPNVLNVPIRVIATRNTMKQILSVEILFLSTEISYSGVCQCIADNGNMKVTRTVYVTIEPWESSGNTSTATFIIVVWVVILMSLGYRTCKDFGFKRGMVAERSQKTYNMLK